MYDYLIKYHTKFSMHEREKNLIIIAKQGNKDAMAKILEENKRINLEHSKKIYWKRI